ncbi:MAG: aminotransferase class I/II-fold pyridoxal phosphate-dependent enzyme [Pirellulales bacterium]|jgi:aspartate/methionine/tyrosine aminotransferase
MKIARFETEHFFARHEFNTPYQLCNSDCETMSIEALLELANVSIADFAQQTLGYTESQGNPELRQNIANTYQSCSPENVVVLATPVEGIYLTARALLEPGDEVIVLSPAYDALINMFEHVVGKENVKKWNFYPNDNGWELRIEELVLLLSPKTKMIVVNFPHNPTGYVPSPPLQQEIIAIAEQNDVWLFSDEMYFGLIHEGTPKIPSMADLSSKSIVLSGLSKTYGLPGLRTGWLIVPNDQLIDEYINWKFYTSICSPGPSEFLATAALKVWNELRERSLSQIKTNLQIADQFFHRWPDHFSWRRPLAGSTALVKFHVDSVNQVAERVATESGVLIQSAVTLGSDDHHLRIGLGRATFETALGKFESWLTVNPIAVDE